MGRCLECIFNANQLHYTDHFGISQNTSNPLTPLSLLLSHLDTGEFVAVTVEVYSPKYNVNSAQRARPGPDNTIINSLFLLFQLFFVSFYLLSKWNAFTLE